MLAREDGSQGQFTSTSAYRQISRFPQPFWYYGRMMPKSSSPYSADLSSIHSSGPTDRSIHVCCNGGKASLIPSMATSLFTSDSPPLIHKYPWLVVSNFQTCPEHSCVHSANWPLLFSPCRGDRSGQDQTYSTVFIWSKALFLSMVCPNNPRNMLWVWMLILINVQRSDPVFWFHLSLSGGSIPGGQNTLWPSRNEQDSRVLLPHRTSCLHIN